MSLPQSLNNVKRLGSPARYGIKMPKRGSRFLMDSLFEVIGLCEFLERLLVHPGQLVGLSEKQAASTASLVLIDCSFQLLNRPFILTRVEISPAQMNIEKNIDGVNLN